MEILVNGQSRQVPAGTTVAKLLQSLHIEARYVAVEVNLDLVPRGCHDQHELVEGDQLEIVTLVGGG
ncbi:MAG: sulfur carrier protein ThiS [Planctomycetota bacterium]|nr:sulfur carrier protein ThiS [Planctomycetota bacterium]